MLYNKQEKLKNKPIITAESFLKSKKISFALPHNIIMLPGASQGAYLKGISKKHYNLFADIDIINEDTAAVYNFSPGGPMCVLLAELIAALGGKNFIMLGSAGALDNELKPGDTVLCTGAFCDEGTSRHYIDADFIEPSKALNCALAPISAKHGHTWTTDALFRETTQEIDYYFKQGAKTVEMEAASLFAFCEAAGLNSAAVFIISDLLYGRFWQPHVKPETTHKIVNERLKSLIDFLN